MIKNQFPITDMSYRLAIVGDFPDESSCKAGSPFMGAVGSLVSQALVSAGAMRSACYFGHVCQERPPNDSFYNFDWEGSEIQSGLQQLREDFQRWKPNCVLLLGNPPITAAGILHGINDFRGSIFSCNHAGSPFFGLKCVAGLHPKTLLKNWGDAPLLSFDVNRAVKQAEFPELRLTQRRALIDMSPGEIVDRLNNIPKGVLISFDIEGGVKQGVTCVSIAIDPQEAFIIPLQDYDDATKAFVMSAFNRIMADPAYPKLLQNSLYDQFVLGWLLKLPVRGVVHDTMLSSWEIYPELPKSLGVQASIWTDQPYYKFERKTEDKRTHYAYCCTDSSVTLEIHQRHMEYLNGLEDKGPLKHYEFNMSLLPSLEFMQLRGIRYDVKGAKLRLEEIQAQQAELQTMAEFNAGQPINMNSPKQMNELLYRKLSLEPQYKKVAGRKTSTLTSDSDALLKLAIKFQHPFVFNTLAWRKLEGVRKQLALTTDEGKRMRCRYNLVGADTGRLSSSKSETGSGTNLQTIMEENRKYYLADEGYHFFQCDLSGADGWTVAVRAAELGDTRMLDDYYAGVKPAKVITLMHLLGKHIGDLSQDEMIKLINETALPQGLYDVCKAVQHGSNYLMGPNRMSENILEKSFKKGSGDLLFVPPSQCKVLQAYYFHRYPGIAQWHDDTAKKLRKNPQIASCSGHRRTFFGRPDNRETLKQALAHEPQHITTYVTNLAMHKLWHDKSNRRADGSLIIEPLHSVHDALCGQFPIELAEESAEKIRSYFNNPITIGKHEITIPFEGGYGPNWFETKEGKSVGRI